MKKLLFCIAVLFFVLLSDSLYSLNNFSYTGIAFNGSGALLTSTAVNVNIKIIQSGSVVYEENHSGVTTDQFGAYTVTVGTGTVVSGSLAGITATKDMKIKSTTNTGGSSGAWVVSSFVKLNNAVTAGSGSGGSGNYWSLTGNTGTTPGTDFLGTTDDQELRLEVRNSGTVEQSLRMNTNQAIFRESGISGITAGNARGQYAADMQIIRALGTQVASGYYSVVGGGENNTASGSHSTVSGGEHNTSSGQYSTVGGGGTNIASGYSSTVAGGFQNTASVWYSFVGGGQENTASTWYATVAGGKNNTASAYSSTIAGGYQNNASGRYSTVAGGYYAIADKYGQNAYASGMFSGLGDAQTSVFVVRNETSNVSATNLYSDGTSASYQMTLNDQDRWTFRALVVGSSNDGSNYGSYIVTGYIYRNGVTTTITGVTTTTVAESSSSYNATAVANGNALAIQVTGDGTNVMRWVARVEVVQLNW